MVVRRVGLAGDDEPAVGELVLEDAGGYADITSFIEQLKRDRPTLEEEQKFGRGLLWDKRIDREAQTVVLKFRPEAKLDPQWLFRVVQERADVMLVPQISTARR